MDGTRCLLRTLLETQSATFEKLVSVNGDHQINQRKMLLFPFHIKPPIGSLGRTDYPLFGQGLQNLGGKKLGGIYFFTDVLDAQLFSAVALGPDIDHRPNTILTSF